MEGGPSRPGAPLKTWILLGLILAAALLYALVPPLREHANRALTVLSMGDVQALKAYILSFGLWAPVVSAALMLLQAVVSPLPAFVITLANGTLFGALWGGLLSWTTALASALACFYIANGLGRPVVERLIGQRGLRIADRFFEHYGKHAVFLARLIPIVPFDPISYGAGLTRMSPKDFILATALGMLPATVIYSWVGYNLGMAHLWVWAAVAGLVLLAGSLAFRFIVRRRMSLKPAGPADVSTPP